MTIDPASHWRLKRISFVCCTIAALTIALPGLLQAQRLPTTVRPQHYALTLTPDLKAATFIGSETIEVTLAEPANSITLNNANTRLSPSSPSKVEAAGQ